MNGQSVSERIKNGFTKDYLTAIKRLDKNYVLFKCKCGKEIIRTTCMFSPYLSKSFSSCGCAHKERRGGKNAYQWAGYGDISGRYWHDLYLGAKDRELSWNITKEYIWDLFVKQNKRCALSDLPIDFALNGKQTASLDRIDSSIGYEEGNLHWTHKDINVAKFDLDTEEYIKWCKLIKEYQNL